MTRKTNIMLIALFAILTIALTACSTPEQQSQATDPGAAELAKCLTEQDFTMYGADWCPHCQSQKEAFGDAFEHVDYVDCEAQQNECEMAGVTGIPMWTDRDQTVSGEQSLEKLASMSGCSY